jgi:hypothetical protein
MMNLALHWFTLEISPFLIFIYNILYYILKQRTEKSYANLVL